MNRLIVALLAVIAIALVVVFTVGRNPAPAASTEAAGTQATSGTSTGSETPAASDAQSSTGSEGASPSAAGGLCADVPAMPTGLTAGNVTQLRTEDRVEGTGEAAEAGDTVSVHYVGRLLDGTTFDSSCERGEPAAFPIGVGQVIRGWDEGIPGMKVGGQRRLIIPSELAYGTSGAGDVIPPNAALVFDVELVGVQ